MTIVSLLKSDGVLIDQKIRTSSHATMEIRVNGDDVNLKTDPSHTWDRTDLLQLSQVIMALAITFENSRLTPERRINTPDFVNLGGFDSVPLPPRRR